MASLAATYLDSRHQKSDVLMQTIDAAPRPCTIGSTESFMLHTLPFPLNVAIRQALAATHIPQHASFDVA